MTFMSNRKPHNTQIKNGFFEICQCSGTKINSATGKTSKTNPQIIFVRKTTNKSHKTETINEKINNPDIF
jgi:hypothetical protein